MPDQEIHIGDRSIQATGNVQVTSQGTRALLSAGGPLGVAVVNGNAASIMQSGQGMLTMENEANVKTDITLQSGPAGSIKIALGPALVGPRIEMTAEGIEIAIGPPGVGASIKLTPVSIQMQVAETEYEMTPLGVTESVAETSRSSTPVGHELSAAESSISLTPASLSIDAPTTDVTAMSASDSTGGMSNSITGAEVSVQGAMVMIN